MNTIRVTHLIDGTVTTDTWTAQHITHQMFRRGRTRICLWNDGRITAAITYRRAERFHQDYGPGGKDVASPPSTPMDAETAHSEGEGYPEPLRPPSEPLTAAQVADAYNQTHGVGPAKTGWVAETKHCPRIDCDHKYCEGRP